MTIYKNVDEMRGSLANTKLNLCYLFSLNNELGFFFNTK